MLRPLSTAPGDIHHDTQPALEASPPEAPGRRKSLLRKAIAAPFLVFLGAALVAEIALQLPPVREALRAKAEEKLAERWPGATIARCAAADVTGVVRFDGVRLPAGDRAGIVLDGLEVAVELRPLLSGKVVPASVTAADTFIEADVPKLGKIALTADQGAQLGLTVVSFPEGDEPARVRIAGPSRACLPSGRCLAAHAFIEAEASRADGSLRLKWQALADTVRIRSNDLAEPPIELPALAAHGDALLLRAEARGAPREAAATTAGAVAAVDARISVGPHGTVDLEATSTGGRFRLDVAATTGSYAKLLESIPLGLPEHAILGVDGPLHATARLSGPLTQPEVWEAEARLDVAKLRALPVNAAAGRALVEPFLYRANADPAAPAMWMGTSNRDFLPLSETPEIVIRAVLLAEDSFFFTHPGFDFDAMAEAMRTNLKAKRVHRGGSTLSQQLAKNLWLSRDRTLLRKMQEALLTVSLEASVPKDRILEIYLNAIEWGPGIYGVKRASRHYFAKDPADLTPKEAAYLATIIPSPKKYYGYFRKGAVSEKWEARVMYLVGKMRDGGFLTEEQYEDAEWTPLRFASSGDDPWTEEIESASVAPVPDDDE